jgi:putative membrane protein
MILRQSSKKISLVAALFLAGVTVLAQGKKGSSGGPTPDQSAAPSSADKGFVIDTLVGNQAQNDMSQLAQHKSASGDVQQFSGHMTQIHDQIEAQLTPFLKVLEISVSNKPSKQEKLEMAKLDTLSGADFDTEYVQAMMKEQQRWLKAFETQSKSSYPYLQKLAESDLPVLTQNFTVLQQIAQAHNITVDSKK